MLIQITLRRRSMVSMTKQRNRENKETVSVVKFQVMVIFLHFPLKWTSLKEVSRQVSLLESLQCEKFCVSSFWSHSNAFIFKIPASGTNFQNTGFLPASAKLTVNYRPGRWNTSHLPTLAATRSRMKMYISEQPNKNARHQGKLTKRTSELHEKAINSKKRLECHLFFRRM